MGFVGLVPSEHSSGDSRRRLPAPATASPADAGGGCLELPFPGSHQSGDPGSPGRPAAGGTRDCLAGPDTIEPALPGAQGDRLVPKDRAQAGRRCGVSGAGGGQLSESSDDLRVSPPTFGGFQEAVCGGGCLARELGLVRFGKLSIDGTKVRANASKRKAMSYGRMRREERRLSEEIEGLLLRARETDAAEDARFGEALRGDELPEECADGRIGWRRSERRRSAWSRGNGRWTLRVDVNPARSGTRRVGGRTNGITVSRRRRRKATSRTRKVGS